MDLDERTILNVISESIGKEYVPIIEQLSKPKHDDKIAEELNMKATIVRTLLNDLHAKNLVEYKRTKNKKTGWYTYLWKKRDKEIRRFIKAYLENKLNELNRQLEIEQNDVIFACSCSRVSLDVAMENNFVCPHCNEKFDRLNNKKIIRKLKAEIAKINSLYK